jgi:hypothetical protein
VAAIKFKKLPNGDITKGFDLESVGTFISLKGTTYAMGTDGSIDADSACAIAEIEQDGDFMLAMSFRDYSIFRHMFYKFPNKF